jgi:hypothetical protein
MAGYFDSLADLLRKGSDTLINLPTEAQRFFTNPQAFTEVVTGKNLLPKETGFVAGATGLPPKNPIQGGALNPTAAPYQEGYEQGEPVAIASMAVPAYAGALRAGAPKAYNALENYMVKSGGMIPLEAYHGTPHKILGKFDINKVGSGEGAQHYGHGMYFAESPAIAAEYKGSDAVKLFANGIETESPVAKQIVRYGGNPQTYIDSMQKVVEKKTKTLQNASKDEILPGLSDYDMAKMDLDGLLKKIDEAKSYKSVETRPVGNFYKVDIPDEEIPKTLNWYESFKNQPKAVQQALRNLGPEIKFGSGKESVADWLKTTGNLPPHLTNQSGNAIYHELSKQLGGAKEASAYLNNLGIKGIKYENFQIRNGAGGGTHNYVMFDPSTVKILEENGKPLSRKELIEKQVKDLKD